MRKVKRWIVIKIITVTPKVQLGEREEPEEMKASIAELDPNMAAMMEKLKKGLRKD